MAKEAGKVSELLKVEFVDRERTFTIDLSDEWWELLDNWANIHQISKEQTLNRMFRSFGEFMQEDLNHHCSPIERLVPEILAALAILPDVPTVCYDCGQPGYSNEQPLGRIVLCTACINKRKEGKTPKQFREDLLRTMEQRDRER